MALKSRYVFGEAWSIARSGARETLLAIGLIALSLYVPALFALVSKNLGRLSAGGESPAAVITLDPGADRWGLARKAAVDPRVREVRIVSSEAALARFRLAYPDLGAALTNLNETPFPPTIEIRLRRSAARGAGPAIASAAREWPGVESAEAEEDFGSRFADAIRIVRGAGLLLGGVLALAAILSVASAIRLALDLHRDEIEIMRLMGATEMAVRAPFWLHAAAEGLAGGALALALLYGTYRLGLTLLARSPHPVLAVFWVSFLGWREVVLLPLLGCAAGFLGSVISLTRNR
ncbi:MAG: permease-like cell division protein FtsX [Acidobacteriota bacterium]